MTNSFKLIAAAVVLGICAVSMSGVMAQQTPVTTLRVVRIQGDFAMALANLGNTFGVTVGLELDTQRYHQVSLSLEDANVTDVMNGIVQSSKKFQCRQTSEFIDVWPSTGSNPLLETKINSFNVKDVSPSEALDQLLNLPEVQANMTTLNLKRRSTDGARDVSLEKLSSPRFSLNLEGVTLREALNRIARESHLGIWIFRNYPNGFFSISSLER